MHYSNVNRSIIRHRKSDKNPNDKVVMGSVKVLRWLCRRCSFHCDSQFTRMATKTCKIAPLNVPKNKFFGRTWAWDVASRRISSFEWIAAKRHTQNLAAKNIYHKTTPHKGIGHSTLHTTFSNCCWLFSASISHFNQKHCFFSYSHTE